VDELRLRLAGLGYATAAPVLLSLLEKIPQPTISTHVTAETGEDWIIRCALRVGSGEWCFGHLG